MAFRPEPNMRAKPVKRFVAWGEIVHGEQYDEHWLQVGELFLPIDVNGILPSCNPIRNMTPAIDLKQNQL